MWVLELQGTLPSQGGTEVGSTEFILTAGTHSIGRAGVLHILHVRIAAAMSRPFSLARTCGHTEAIRVVRQSVSRKHAEVHVSSEFDVFDLHALPPVHLVDLNSRFGTCVDGRRCKPEEQVPLQSGSLINFGTPSVGLRCVHATIRAALHGVRPSPAD